MQTDCGCKHSSRRTFVVLHPAAPTLLFRNMAGRTAACHPRSSRTPRPRHRLTPTLDVSAELRGCSFLKLLTFPAVCLDARSAISRFVLAPFPVELTLTQAFPLSLSPVAADGAQRGGNGNGLSRLPGGVVLGAGAGRVSSSSLTTGGAQPHHSRRISVSFDEAKDARRRTIQEQVAYNCVGLGVQ